MKYIKKYENIREPEVGDYIIGLDINTSSNYRTASNIFNAFLSKNVGKIIHKGSDSYKIIFEEEPPLKVLEYAFYEKDSNRLLDLINLPGVKIYNNYTNITDLIFKEIVDFSTDKEELEMKLAAKKYNL